MWTQGDTVYLNNMLIHRIVWRAIFTQPNRKEGNVFLFFYPCERFVDAHLWYLVLDLAVGMLCKDGFLYFLFFIAALVAVEWIGTPY